jgi:hypothetical protein
MRTFIVSLFWLAACHALRAAEPPAPIPYNQDQPPGPPLSPEEAIAKMTVPPPSRTW